jgi:hypothetical protein
MNDLKFAFRQLLKNPGFTAVAVLTLALDAGVGPLVMAGSSGSTFRPAIKQAHADNLSSVNEIPVGANPHHEQLDARLRRDSQALRMPHRKRLAVGQVQLEAAERRSVAHFFNVGDFHDRAPNVNDAGIIFN